MRFLSFLLLITFYHSFAFSLSYTGVLKKVPYSVCFTPGANCESMIVENIQGAKKSIYVQAYSFTSKPIAEALVRASKNNIDVKVILDKSQFNKKTYSASRFFMNQKIPLWKDYKVTIAHNKTMIIDKKTVITGSYNFTRSALAKNSENVLIITNSKLAREYFQNWKKRLKASQAIKENLSY